MPYINKIREIGASKPLFLCLKSIKIVLRFRKNDNFS